MQRHSILGLLVLTAGGGLLASCNRAVDPDVRGCSRIAQTHLWDTKLDAGHFAAQDVRTQYEIYICASQYVHPPLHFAEEFAAEGDQALPFLVEKLRRTDHDATKVGIIEVLVQMDRQGSADIAHNATVMALLRSKVDTIRDTDDKVRAEQLLARIGERRS